MDFFERQDRARRHAKLLVFYLAIAVVMIVAAVYLVALVALAAGHSRHPLGSDLSLWNPRLFCFTSAITLGVILIGSITKSAQLAEGGRAVAETLGGRLIAPNTTDPDERKLRNVVEEMAIASGVSVPQVYVLDEEKGINAFAAGHSPADAVIGVSRGCMKLLSRDELQGVIGHEFSHILNGDMRLNLRLIGILFGILCIATIGRVLMSTRSRSYRDRNALPLLGLALMAIGAIGVFFGRLIQAGVSRQREFLADASSVQFTRNPAGLSGALQKIGGLPAGSRLESEHAADACHMFFGNALGESFVNAMATHPPLTERIRAIDASWDGTFPKVDASTLAADAAPRQMEARRPPAAPPVFGMPLPQATRAGLVVGGIQAQAVLPNLGKPTTMHLHYAVQLRNSLPENLRAAAREPLDAAAMIYAMLLTPDNGKRDDQLKQLAGQTTPAISARTAELFPEIGPIASRARLPLVSLAMPALGHLSRDEFDQFSRALDWLIDSHGPIEAFEFVLRKIVLRDLAPRFGPARPPIIQYYAVKPLVPDCCVVLSVLAQAGADNPDEARKAFLNGAPYLRAPEGALQLLAPSECGLERLDEALNRLAQAAPQIKKNLIEACAYVVGADGIIQEQEAELLRAVAVMLDCPIPPFVE